MRTNIEIDDELMADAMAAGRFKTKREAVEAGLALVKRQAAYQEILKHAGKLPWGWPGDERLSGRPNWHRVDDEGRELPDAEPPAGGTSGGANGRR
ncbi:type II toxin-antitoxin system VapB family antitoxin [Roseateles sp.]|jgi:Arc/MetJ family transcription regulator|uniref:type II toxin-antitoxin system VapB family antitoxin n=1 Tax=Roseateles sp. TaxID=1971397 RepID=UPI003BACF115